MGLNLQGKRTCMCIYVAIINSSCSHSRVPEFGKFSLSLSLDVSVSVSSNAETGIDGD